MDWFSFWLDSFTITAQGILLFLFATRFTNKKVKIIHSIYFLLLLYIIVIITDKFNFQWLDTVLELLALYIINRIILKNSLSISYVTTFLAVISKLLIKFAAIYI